MNLCGLRNRMKNKVEVTILTIQALNSIGSVIAFKLHQLYILIIFLITNNIIEINDVVFIVNNTFSEYRESLQSIPLPERTERYKKAIQ